MFTDENEKKGMYTKVGKDDQYFVLEVLRKKREERERERHIVHK